MILKNSKKCKVFRQVGNRLGPAIRAIWRGKLSEDVLVLQDNASHHTIARTGETLHGMLSAVLHQPAGCPELATSDFHLFGPPDSAAHGLRFTDDDEVK
jgi:hypothetical protein